MTMMLGQRNICSNSASSLNKHFNDFNLKETLSLMSTSIKSLQF